MAGPTDNINYVLTVGDKLRPGTIYWCAGSNLDAWPDTNQADLTDPSEALVNVAMAAGYAVVFTIKRGFVYTPNFFNALATVTGTSGSTWTQQATTISVAFSFRGAWRSRAAETSSSASMTGFTGRAAGQPPFRSPTRIFIPCLCMRDRRLSRWCATEKRTIRRTIRSQKDSSSRSRTATSTMTTPMLSAATSLPT